MFERSAAGLTLYELDRALKAAEPAALLVPPRILRRVIRADQPDDLGVIVPHRKAYLIAGSKLLNIVDADEIGLAPGEKPPESTILIETPDALLLADMPRRLVMLRYWRLLFHMAVHRVIEEKHLSDADLRSRIDVIGATAFAEARAVLQSERFLLQPEDDRSVYTEFAAIYLDLVHFDPRGLSFFFPALAGATQVLEMLEADVGARDLCQRTRLRGAADPLQPHPNAPTAPRLRPIGQAIARRAETDALTRQAESAAVVGNNVRAALLHASAAREHTSDDLAAAHAEIDKLLDRLGAALGLEHDAPEARRLLYTLLPLAADSVWPVEARLLYDLQKICIDHERELYAVDLVEYVISLGKRPVQRPLPAHQAVLILQYLQSALRRLPSTRLDDEDRRLAAGLLKQAIHRYEERLRARFRPFLTTALEDVGLLPQNYPERVSRHKLVEELLDKVCERGFLTVGELRDAVSSNRLKLEDLSGPREFVMGDCLIRLNRRLREPLDGVYRPAEIYLRWLQRLSSVAFGTPVGRFLTRYAVLPFGGAYMILKGAHEIVHFGNAILATAEGEEPHHVQSFATPYSIGILGLFLFALLHWPAFRERVLDGVFALGNGLRWLFFDLPAAIIRLPLLQSLFASPVFQWCKQWVLKPVAWSAPLTALLSMFTHGATSVSAIGFALYVVAAITLNTRLGRAVEETCSDWLFRTWKQIEGDIIPGLFWLIIAIFKQLLNLSEQFLYTVDEWLRFRKGESRVAYWLKMYAGVVWFFVTYIFRIVINLMVEPTINPIKHFPVVTVAAKLLLPFAEVLRSTISHALDPFIGVVLGNLVALSVIFFIPGLAGFLVWELKENWRLYKANRVKELRPEIVGHHGETVVRLLRPGIHSGTVPKTFAKLRKAWRTARMTGQWRTFRKHREALDGVEHSVHEFVEREFLELLRGSQSWGGAKIQLHAVHLWTNRINLDFSSPSAGEGDVRVGWTLRDGMLLGEVLEAGWLPGLRAEQRDAFAVALAGLHRFAGVQFLSAQTAARVGRLSAARGHGILYSEAPLPWSGWVAAWERDQAGAGVGTEIVNGIEVLPRGEPVAVT
jgi:hypothetical protein